MTIQYSIFPVLFFSGLCLLLPGCSGLRLVGVGTGERGDAVLQPGLPAVVPQELQQRLLLARLDTEPRQLGRVLLVRRAPGSHQVWTQDTGVFTNISELSPVALSPSLFNMLMLSFLYERTVRTSSTSVVRWQA